MGGLIRAHQQLVVWVVILTIIVFWILIIMPKQERYTELHRRVSVLEYKIKNNE